MRLPRFTWWPQPTYVPPAGNGRVWWPQPTYIPPAGFGPAAGPQPAYIPPGGLISEWFRQRQRSGRR